MVQVGLDGILFNDFSFYGPDLLNSRRIVMVWETEAQRDRQHFKSVLARYGPEGLRRLALDSLNLQAARPRGCAGFARWPLHFRGGGRG